MPDPQRDAFNVEVTVLLRKLLAAAAAASTALGFAVSAQAAAITLNGITFTEQTGDFVIDGGSGSGTADDPFRLQETVTGSDVTMTIGGLADYMEDCSLFEAGECFKLIKEVKNNTGETWNFYDHELQETLGTPSPDGDGLSFAQGVESIRPFTSDTFAQVEEEIEDRDFVNFFDGSVAPGETVSFTYWIHDASPEDSFFLRQRPNFSVTVSEPATMLLIGAGFVGVSAVARRRRKRASA